MAITESKLIPADDSNLTSNERVMSERASRALAGIWFAFAAAIPVGYFFLRDPLGGGSFSGFNDNITLTAAVPILIAGVCGLALGADILDPAETKNVFQAAGRGLLIGLLSYLVLFIGMVVVLLPKSPDSIAIIVAGVVFFFYGLIFLGWLIALVGAGAGALLYLYRQRRLKA